MNINVIGAGLTGAVASRLMAESGYSVHVFEKRSHIGGNCFDEKTEEGITVQRYGPHIFHTNDQEAWNFCSRFTKFRPYQHRVLSYVDGQFVPFPINRDTLCQLFGVELSIMEVESFLKLETEKSLIPVEPTNFREAVISQVGEYLYTKMFREYTRKQWQTEPDHLAKEVAGRIPVRFNRDNRYFTDKYQGIPQEGYTKMIQNMLDHPNITIEMDTEYTPDDDTDDFLIYTGRIDEYFHMKYGELNYRSVRFEFETYEGDYQTVGVVNYPNDYDFIRITEFKHFTGEKSDKTVILKEYPSSEGVPSYVVLDDRNMKLRTLYMDDVKNIEHQHKALFIGRLAEYKYYNMDQVVSAALKRVGSLIDELKIIKEVENHVR
ncbi:UDP-galactopyranose mutase [Proteiniclasticum sp.]|uniref:UDP-galactopyranose mutase n=1 Tax=Proteiniclasticum sp. TaxID=2053595 RepID=UPI00289638BC|nr:UDP-galactopyranose mutase [Proteiniclasticum sp.]